MTSGPATLPSLRSTSGLSALPSVFGLETHARTSATIETFFDELALVAARDALTVEPELDRVVARLVAGYDASHSITHLRNTWWLCRAIATHSQTPSHIAAIAARAAYVHDCMDHKYLTPAEAAANEEVLRLAMAGTADPVAIDLIFRVVEASSFSARRARLQAGESEFPVGVEDLCRLVSDADLLEAYDPRRVMTFQHHRVIRGLLDPSLELGWCRTILEKRILRYRDDWMRTMMGKSLAIILHPRLERWVGTQEWWSTAVVQPY